MTRNDAPAVRFPLLTEHFTIRPMREEDAGALLEVYGDVVAMAHLTADVPTDAAQALEWVRAKIDLHERTGLSLWTVEDRRTGEIVGDAGLQHEREEGGDVGLGGRLIRRFWGRGYATEVGAVLLDAAFDHLGLEEVVSVTRPDNAAARAVSERLGMRFEGLVAYFGDEDGHWAVYRITAEERGTAIRG